MNSAVKEYASGFVMAVLTTFLVIVLFLVIVGCATAPRPRKNSSPDPALGAAATDASLIDAKTVVIQQYLRSTH